MDKNEILKRQRKKITVLLITLVLIAGILFFVSPSKAGSTDDLIDQMITAYGKKQESASKLIEENLRAKSLRTYCNKYLPEAAIRTSMSDYREQDWMVNVPLWMIAMI